MFRSILYLFEKIKAKALLCFMCDGSHFMVKE